MVLRAEMMQRAAQRLRESATPLYRHIMDRLGGFGLPPLGAGAAPLTTDSAKAQRAGWRGFFYASFFEPPSGRGRNKFTKQASAPFTGVYPRHLCNARGLQVFYPERGR